MKLMFAVVQNDDVKPLTRALIDKEISVTRISSTGGFLRGGNTTLMIGIDEARVEEALEVIREKSSRRHTVTVPASGIPHTVDSTAMPLTIVVGGATVFVLSVDEYYKF